MKYRFRAWYKGVMRHDVYFNDEYCFENLPDAYGGWDGWSADLDDVELMIFTGLKDENGCEIWEGDIINLPNHLRNTKNRYAEVVIYSNLQDIKYKALDNAQNYGTAHRGLVCGNKYEVNYGN